MKLKRVWDVTEKKIARVPWANWKPCQVWLKVEEEKFYKQDINGLVEITDEEFNVYWPNWKAMDSDDVLGYYDTDEPTELFTPEDWAEATYTFEDYDETVLKTGKVKDWETPVAPEDPTREGYIFKGWKPKVKAIYKDTTYTAQYEEVPEPELMTYEELAALETSTAILEELNTNDEGYYTSLTAEEHTFETTAEWVTMSMIVSEKWETYETSTPLVVDGNTFIYIVEWEMEGLDAQTWYAMPYTEWE